MKTLEQIKDEIVKEFGYESFEQFDDNSTLSYDHETPKIIDAIATIYAREVAQASLQKAAENVTLIEQINGEDFSHLVDKESITNPNNITLL